MNRSDICDAAPTGGEKGHGDRSKTADEPRRPRWQFADLGRKPALGSHRSIHGSD